MNVNDYLSADGEVIIALCTALGVQDKTAPDLPEPFTLSEWNELSRKLENSSLKRPANLQEANSEKLGELLSMDEAKANRIVRLLERRGEVARELVRLSEQGIWAVAQSDDKYPARLLTTLKHHAPSVLFGAGPIELLNRGGVAVVGSRHIDEPAMAFAREVGRRAAGSKVTLVSGGARGSDRIGMDGSLQAGGRSIGVLADSLESTIRKPDVQEFLHNETLVLTTPYLPSAGFSVGGAMGRNKLIYGLSDYAVVVSSDYKTGGTWAGAVEALKAGWCSVFVRESAGAPQGNAELMKLGGKPFSEADLVNVEDISDWLKEHSRGQLKEQDLFG